MNATLPFVIVLVGFLPLAVRSSLGWRGVSLAELVAPAAGLFLGVVLVVAWVSGPGLEEVPSRGIHRSYLAMAAISFLLFTGAAWFAAEMARRAGCFKGASLYRAVKALGQLSALKMVIVLSAIWVVRLYLALSQGIFYSGSDTPEAILRLPYWMSVVSSLTAFFVVVVPVWACVRLMTSERWVERILPTLVIILEVLYAFTQGRRAMAFLGVLVALVYLLTKGRVTWRFVTSTAVGAGIMVLVAFPAFIKARQVIGERLLPQKSSAALVYYMAATADIPDEMLYGVYRRNVYERSRMYLDWSAEILQAQEGGRYLLGRAVLSDVLFVTPTLLLPEKHSWEWGEGLINEFYHITRGDSPNSVVAYGLADFGLAGTILYGFLVVIGLALAERWLGRRIDQYPLVASAGLFQLLSIAVLVERALVSSAAMIRNLVLLLLVASTIVSARRLFSSSRQ